jgi:hypothetical protein
MLSRREVLIQLRGLGVKDLSLLKAYLRDFEKYMKKNYGLEVTKKRIGRGERGPQLVQT